MLSLRDEVYQQVNAKVRRLSVSCQLEICVTVR